MNVDCPPSEEDVASILDIEQLFDSCFWGPLLAGSDVIDKLFVTGTVSMKSSALENLHLLNLRAVPTLQVSCGFTEQETLKIARLMLNDIPDIAELRRSCGEYFFSSHQDGDLTEPVFHPQRVIALLSELSLHHPYGNDRSFHPISVILQRLPEASNVLGAVTTESLIDLLASGAVQVDIGTDAPFDLQVLTWSALYQFGALTYDPHLKNALRIANSAILSLVSLLP